VNITYPRYCFIHNCKKTLSLPVRDQGPKSYAYNVEVV